MSLHLSLPPETKPLDNRRLHYLRAVEWERGKALIGLGPDREGCVREIWIEPPDYREGGAKYGSDFLNEASAGCMMASWLLQDGMSAAELRAKLMGGSREERDTGVIIPAFVARALAEAVKLETECGDEIRATYAHEAEMRAARRALLAAKP
jgi:hypothetical protein